MTSKEALEKLDNTLCLNSPVINFNIDDEDFIDCKDVDEMIECLETIERDLDVLEIIKNKRVDIQRIIDAKGDYKLYNAFCVGYADKYICNEEEFNKIKERL